MLIAAHSTTGAVVGEVLANPILAIIFGIVSHYILDFIPHFDTTDEGVYTKRQVLLISFDALFGAIVLAIMFLSSTQQLSFAFGVFGSLLPDILDNSPFWSKKLHDIKFFKKIYDFHASLQRKEVSASTGIGVQVAIVFLNIFIFFQAVVI